MIKKSILFVLFASNVAFAGGEAVNCRTETVQQTFYYGWASCTAWSGANSLFLTENIQRSSTPWVTLSQYDAGTQTNYSCSTSLTSSFVEDVPVTVCDYYPSVSIDVDYFSYGEAYIDISYSDSDGHIVSKEFTIDGVAQNGDSAFVHGYPGQAFLVKAKVTDDDGYSAARSLYVTLEGGPLNPF